MMPNENREPMTVDDPRLTAYALGELDAAEVPAVQALLARSAEARAELAAIRELAGVLGTELAAEPAPAPGLADAQKAAIEQALEGSERGGSILRAYAWPALAAALLIGFVLWSEQQTETARETPDMAPVADAGKHSGPFTYTLFGEARKQQAPVEDPSLIRLRSLGYLGSADDRSSRAPMQGGQGGGGGGSRVDPSLPELEALRSIGYDSSGMRTNSGETETNPAGLSAPDPGAKTQHLGQGEMYRPASTGQLTGRGRVAGAEAAGNAPAPPANLRDALEQPVVLGYLSSDELAKADIDGPARRGMPDYCYWRVPPTAGGERYAPIVEQGFATPFSAPLSTFSIDVDTASYANVRRFLLNGQLPPMDAVRIEELVNYFDYDYPQPDGDVPFAVDLAVTEAPWARQHRLVRIGIKGREIATAERAPSNLVFLVDVSGSMQSQDKLPLLVASLKMLVGELDARDRVALVTYAGHAGLVLDSTPCTNKAAILAALDNLRAGGSTHGSQGIALAYDVARRHFLDGGTNRVILATDGDFNVGITDKDSLQRLIEQSAKSHVFLSVLLFGTGNIKDDTAELLADKGNGNYSYIDSFGEARKVLVNEMGGTLVTIAKDVKIQVEFNPAKVGAYRLIGYENRALAARDFNDDTKDAGEIGAGHTVTALYEIVPRGVALDPTVDPLRYQQTPDLLSSDPVETAELIPSDELLTVKLRWKEPESDTSTKIQVPLTDAGTSLEQAGGEVAFAAAVACYGMLLRHSDLAGDASWDTVAALAERGRGKDSHGYRAEFLQLVQLARGLSGQ